MNILFFDGFCSLCNALVGWVLRRDREGRISLATLQGETAKKMKLSPSHIGLSSLFYLRNGRSFSRSSAVLVLLWDLGWPWKAASVLFAIPKPVRDFVYGIIAKYRYVIFGKCDDLRGPTDREAGRFLS